jgi:hypothetical protein
MSEHSPILAPSDGAFTIKAVIIGLGRYDGSVVEFNYNTGVTPVTPGGPAGGGSGGSITPPGTVTIETDAVPLGAMPSVSFTVAELHDKILEAVAEDGVGILELRLGAADFATAVEVKIQAESIKEMIDAALTALVISSPLGATSYDLAALKAMYVRGTRNECVFKIRIVDPAELNESLQAIVSDNVLYEVTVTRGGTPVSSLGLGKVTVQLRYVLKDGQRAQGVRLWHLSAEGVLTEIESEYDSDIGYLQFVRHNHGYFLIGYDQQGIELSDKFFTDVEADDWFYDMVYFVNERGLMTGTSTEPMLFSPNMPLNRAMAVTVLYRMQGAVLATAETNHFADVDEVAWYADPVKWAHRNGIVSGYGDLRFGPEDNITREQMAAVLFGYAEFSGMDVSIGEDTNILSYQDVFEVSEWAITPMQWAIGSGLITGKPGGYLDPEGKATRGEFAAVIMRFIELTGKDNDSVLVAHDPEESTVTTVDVAEVDSVTSATAAVDIAEVDAITSATPTVDVNTAS